jgi:preprotein translocase subunit YajC
LQIIFDLRGLVGMKEILTYFPLLQDQAPWMMIMPFGLIILVFYFLIIRPQNKKQKETQKMLAALKKNDRVTTAGGIRGVVVSVKEDTVIIKVDDNVKLEFSKGSISSVRSREGTSENPKGSSDSSSSKDEQSKSNEEDQAESDN